MSYATNNQQASSVKRAPPPAFDPERPMLVQPWREFEGRGWLEVMYLGGSITRTVKVKLLAPLLSEEEKKTSEEVFVGASEAKERVVKAGLWAPKGAKKAGSGGKQVVDLPKKSLCKEDFKGNDQSLLARARSVANTLGERTAAGRIGSMGLTRKGKDTFESWWQGAGADRKARLLTDKKHYDSLVNEDKTRLNTVLSDCPFRGDGPVPVKEEEEPASAPAQTEQKAEGAKPKSGKSGKGKAPAAEQE